MIVRADAVFDTSFWAHAFGAGLLPSILRRYALHCPPAVAGELPEHFRSGQELQHLLRSGEVMGVSPGRDQIAMFGPGEREAINVALEHRDWMLLLDDRRAFLHAADLGLQVLCTPLLLIHLTRVREIHEGEVERLLGELAKRRTLSPALVALARDVLRN